MQFSLVFSNFFSGGHLPLYPHQYHSSILTFSFFRGEGELGKYTFPALGGRESTPPADHAEVGQRMGVCR